MTAVGLAGVVRVFGLLISLLVARPPSERPAAQCRSVATSAPSLGLPLRPTGGPEEKPRAATTGPARWLSLRGSSSLSRRVLTAATSPQRKGCVGTARQPAASAEPSSGMALPMNLILVFAVTPQCATSTGRLIGGLLIAAFALAILVCAIGWSRAANRASRAEGELKALRQSSAR